jgi:hypothetical protein
MRMIATSIIALGIIGTMAGATATTSSAQGVYFQGPGFDVGIGQPAYRERYYPGYYDYNYSGPTVYSERRHYSPPVVYERRTYRRRSRDRDWD